MARNSRSTRARIALIGNSAGAQLGALVALAGDYPTTGNAYRDDPYASVSTKVKAVVGVYGSLRSDQAVGARRDLTTDR